MKVCIHAQKNGVFLRPLGDVIVLMPSLNFSVENLSRLVKAIGDGLDTLLTDTSKN